MVTATNPYDAREAFLQDKSGQIGGGAISELPPSERDFLLFEAVAFGGASTRQAAAEFEISQTRVVQIRKHVARWIATSVPDGLDLMPIQRLRLAAHIAEGRVDFLYAQAVEAWRQSKQPATSVCRGRLTGETRTTRDSHGEPRYLLVAARIVERQLQLAGTARKVLTSANDREREAREGDAREGEAPAEPRTASFGCDPGSVGKDQTSPVRDCSLHSRESKPGEVEQVEAADATADGEEACNELENRRRAFLDALKDDTAAVHPPFTDAGGMLLDATEPVGQAFHLSTPPTEDAADSVVELSINGQTPGAVVSFTAVAQRPASIPLNRHERRARQRELDRLRRRAR